MFARELPCRTPTYISVGRFVVFIFNATNSGGAMLADLA